MSRTPSPFLNPAPVTPELMTTEEMAQQAGGFLPVIYIIIISCGGSLGTASIITVGTVGVHIAD